MLVNSDKNANILHFLSIKELTVYSGTHTHILFRISMMFHNEIFAFITLSAVKNAEKKQHGENATTTFLGAV